MIRTKVQHDQKVADVIANLKDSKLTAISKKAMRAAGKVVRTRAKAVAPKRSGATKAGIGTKIGKFKTMRAGAYAITGVKRRFKRTYKGKTVIPTKYSAFIRKGVQPHYVYKGAKNKGGGKPPRTNPPFPPSKVSRKHPGHKGNDYIKRAENQSRDQAMRVASQVFGYEIGKAMFKPKKGRKR